MKRRIASIFFLSFFLSGLAQASNVGVNRLTQYLPKPGYYLFYNAKDSIEILTVTKSESGKDALTCIKEWDSCIQVGEKGIWEKEDVWLPSDLVVGRKWQGAENVVTVIRDINASVKTKNKEYQHCLELEVYYPAGVLEDKAVEGRDYWCRHYGYVKMQVKRHGKYVTDLVLGEYYPTDSHFSIKPNQLLGRWEIYSTSITPKGLPNKEFYEFKTDGTVNYIVGDRVRNYEYVLLPDRIVIFREYGITLSQKIVSFSATSLELEDQNLGVRYTLKK